MQEHHFYCPHCHAGNAIIIDSKAKSKQLVADCEICAHPVELRYNFDLKQRLNFKANFASPKFVSA